MSNPYYDKTKYKLGRPKKSDPRRETFRKQRKSWGFDERELWSLDDTILKFLVPRLKIFKDSPGVSDKVNQDVQEMIECFEYVLDNLYSFTKSTLPEFERCKKRGAKLLGKNLGALWF